jgi:hypothetical protein
MKKIEKGEAFRLGGKVLKKTEDPWIDPQPEFPDLPT